MSSTDRWVAVGLLALVAGCQAPDQGAQRKPPAPDQKVGPCPDVAYPVRISGDSIPHGRACDYVRDAQRVLAAAGPSDGVAAGDTSRITLATVDAIAQVDSVGGPVAAWWLVTLRLEGRSYDGEVRFDQRTGHRSIRPVHR